MSDYIAHLKAKAIHRAIQEAEVIPPEEAEQADKKEDIPPVQIGFMPAQWSADDLQKFESLADGGDYTPQG